MLRDSTTAVVVVVVRMCQRAILLAMIHMRKSIHGFPFVPLYGYGAPLGVDLRYNKRPSDLSTGAKTSASTTGILRGRIISPEPYSFPLLTGTQSNVRDKIVLISNYRTQVNSV